jgi:hypothetical protein
MEFIFLFVIFSIVSAVIGALLYILLWMPLRANLKSTNRLSAKQSRHFTYAYIFAFLAIPAFVAYAAAYPGDDFYAEEFKTVTLRNLPPSAKIIAGEASYPDFHGDYTSHATIELSPADFQNLKADLAADNRISKAGENKYPDEPGIHRLSPAHPDVDTFFFRQVKSHPDKYLAIEFSRNSKTVYITVSST